MANQNINLRLINNATTRYTFSLKETVSVQLPSVIGSTPQTKYYMPKLPRGLNFDTETRMLSGTTSQINNKNYEYIAVNTSGEIGVFNIYIAVYRTQTQKDQDYANDDRHDLKFFKRAINYGSAIRHIFDSNTDNIVNEIADNDYNTFDESPSERVYNINTTQSGADASDSNLGTNITHLFLKTKGVTSFRTRFSKRMESGSESSDISIPSTVINWEGRDVPIEVDGFQNFLYTLPDKQEEITQLDLTLTPESSDGFTLYEVMVLDEILSLNANSQFSEIIYSLQDFGSILKKDLAERITKVPISGSPRWQWQIEYTALLQSNQVNTTKYNTGTARLERNKEKDIYNEILNLIRDRNNNNIVVSCEFTRYPTRVFPATFPNTELGTAYLSDRFKGAGETISFTVLES